MCMKSCAFVTTPKAWCVPRSFSLLTTNSDESTQIVAHEDAERRAMEGELAELERAWRDAEEIAAIADNMFLPPNVAAFFKSRA